MYSNKENVNILTSLLIAHDVQCAVLCPGSRNSPMVHNLVECNEMKCYSVTDERSAGFVAIGIAEATDAPVVLCVTSGSALLNAAPAVAEAYYRNIPLIVVSADRPQQWIGQSDGQTLQQVNALEPHVRKSVNIIEPHTEEERWYCNRVINEALNKVKAYGGGPVHINVPLTEPLYEYTVAQLPDERYISFGSAVSNESELKDLITKLDKATKPVIVIGQLDAGVAQTLSKDIAKIEQNYVVLHEKLSTAYGSTALQLDEMLAMIAGDEDYLPDFILYFGGTIVSKRLKQYLRKAKTANSVLIDEHGEVRDVFMNLSWVIQAYPAMFVQLLAAHCKQHTTNDYYQKWAELRKKASQYAENFCPDYSQMLAAKTFHTYLSRQRGKRALFYANSSSVRLGNIYSKEYIHVNRGVNGIEGSLSVAVGYSLEASDNEQVYCVVGDLSFFYDNNALWNTYLKKNLKVLLLNNGSGGIFHQMLGPSSSPYCNQYIAAGHQTSTEGICQSYGLKYQSAHNKEDLSQQMKLFVKANEGPLLLEVFTNADEDARVMNEYYRQLKEEK